MINEVYLTDCMEYMKTVEDKYFDLIFLDPPYNIKKAEWDNFKSDEDYYNFILNCMHECQRISKDNSSTYFFHNDFEKIVELQYRIKRETNYIFRQFITWNKMFNESKNKGYLQGYIESNLNRNYQKLAEYILFYTFQDETGLTKIMDSCVYPIRDYIRNEIIRAKGKIILKEINNILGTANNGGGVASAILSLDKTVPAFITKTHYEKLRKWLNKTNEYEYLRNEYEDLRNEYEDLRYYYNNQKTHHSVWNYDFESSWHPTPKPKELIRNILLHSCRPNGKVFNPFNGSENIRTVCYELGIDFIGCENDNEVFKKQEEMFQLEKARIDNKFYIPDNENFLFK